MTAVEPGRVTVELSMAATRVATVHDAVEVVRGRGPTMVQHDQRIGLADVRLTMEAGLAEEWAVGFMIPWRLVDAGIGYVDSAGDTVDLVSESIHHRNELIEGIGDPWLWVRWSAIEGDFTLGARAGVSLPAGRTEDDPFLLGDLGLDHQHIQLGTGTVNPIFGVDVAWDLGGWSLHSWATTQQVLYENSRGYQAGSRYGAALTALSGLGTESFTFQAGIELQVEAAERWRGLVHTEDGNQGRADVLATAAVGWRLTDAFNISAGVKVPAYVHVVGAQLEYPLLATLTIGGVVETGEEESHDHGHSHSHEHEHEHEHGHEEAHEETAASWEGLDMIEVSRAGEDVELVPVPGKVTVFDFWATWCAPCRELDTLLARLAREHPGRIAVRKVEVVDGESPAWKRYLAPGDHGLPHVKVFAPDGSLAIEQSGDPHALVEAVEALLER